MLELGPGAFFLADLTVAATTCSAAVAAGDTSLTLTAVTGLPDSGIVKLTESAKTEYVYYNGVDTSGKKLLNCIRGMLGTTAQSFTTSGAVAFTARNLGKTLGGIKVNIDTSSVELKSDQSGEMPEDETISGRTCKIEANLADITLENFASAMGTVVVGSGTAKCVNLNPGTGTSLMANAKRAYILPLVNGYPTTDGNRTIHIYKAGVKASLDLTFDSSTQRSIKLSISAYPDASNNNNFMTIGDTAAA